MLMLTFFVVYNFRYSVRSFSCVFREGVFSSSLQASVASSGLSNVLSLQVMKLMS